MYKEERLPQNAKEGLLFLLIVSLISFNIIAPLITGLELGFSKEIYLGTLKNFIIIWPLVIFTVQFVAKPIVQRIIPKFICNSDGFNARILFNILFNVTILSMIFSIIGNWVGMREVSIEPLKKFFHVWFRNFGIAFWVEVLIAQPIARQVMKTIHLKKKYTSSDSILSTFNNLF